MVIFVEVAAEIMSKLVSIALRKREKNLRNNEKNSKRSLPHLYAILLSNRLLNHEV